MAPFFRIMLPKVLKSFMARENDSAEIGEEEEEEEEEEGLKSKIYAVIASAGYLQVQAFVSIVFWLLDWTELKRWRSDVVKDVKM